MTTCAMCENEFKDIEIEIHDHDISVCYKCSYSHDFNERIIEIHEARDYAREREETDRGLTHWGKGIS